MNKFRLKLTFIFILIIGLSVLVSGIFMVQILEKSQLETIKENRSREIRTVIANMEWKHDGDFSQKVEYYTRLAKQIQQTTEARITIIQEDGIVLGDSDIDPISMENHLHREEIIQAQEEGTGYSIRYSDTVNTDMLYVAAPVYHNGSIDGYFRLAISLQQIESSIRNFWGYLIFGLMILFLIAGLVSYRIALGLTKPLEQITSVAKQISNLDYNSRVNIKNQDEIGELGQAINTMADNLQRQVHHIAENENKLLSVLDNMTSGVMLIDSYGKIVLLNRSSERILGYTSKELLDQHYLHVKLNPDFNRLIEQCVNNRVQLRDEMMLYYPEERILEMNLAPMLQEDGQWSGVVVVMHDITSFKRLEKVRSEFVANVSHELRTPIASVKGFAETLLAGALDDLETAMSFLQIIHDESDRLNRLIGDISELSQIESKRILMDYAPIDMQTFVSNTLNMMKNEANKKGVSLEMNVAQDVYIEADEDRLRQIFINLISNAIAYTPEKGKIKVTVELDNENTQHDDVEWIKIMISDTGVGIPKKDLPRLFERFYRVDKARTRSSGGTGLGLSIVKHLVELHKGMIQVESTLGVGTTFIIKLPVIQ